MRQKTNLHVLAVLFIATLLVPIVLPGSTAAAEKTVRLAYVEWSETIASTNMVQAVLQEKMGYMCEIIPYTADKMWQAVADGVADAMVAAWLPSTHGHYYEAVKDQVVNLGPNMEGTQIGLVVPNITVGRQTAASGQQNAPYITVDAIADLNETASKFNHKIIGIDPEAGIMKRTREAMRAYGLTKFRLVEGSEVSMTAELSNAIRRQRWIVVTGWVPHWMFARWNLKFLDDPKGIYGGKERIDTIVRKDLKEDMPEVYAMLDNFFWNAEDLGQLMIWIQEDNGMFPYDKCLRFMRYHEDKIKAWIP